VEEGGFSDEPVQLSAEEKRSSSCLQYKNLSIRHLNPETKGRVRAAMEGLHWTRELSLNDIANLVGNKDQRIFLVPVQGSLGSSRDCSRRLD